jgi:hypothetical protein
MMNTSRGEGYSIFVCICMWQKKKYLTLITSFVMRLFDCMFIGIVLIKLSHSCRFIRTFYQRHSNIFQLDDNQTSLTIRPLYALSNQSFSAHSIGIIYRLADTYLVPVPLLFQCSQSKRISSPIDCEFSLIDTRVSYLYTHIQKKNCLRVE